MTLIARNQIIHAGFHSTAQNMVVRRVGQDLKILTGFNNAGARADSSDYIPDLFWREAKFRPAEHRLVFPEKKRRHKKLYPALRGKVQKQGR